MDKHVVIYVHGFLSSARALKATQTKEYIISYEPDLHYDSIDLPNTPKEAFAELDLLIKSYIRKDFKVSLIGSSMGGFLSMYMSAKYNIKAVLINPCVYPWDLMGSYVDKNHINPYTQIEFTITHQDIENVKKIAADYSINPKLLALFVQRGDEVLSYENSCSLLHDAALVHIEDGGNHRFEGFDSYLPEIIKFLRK
ncbi:MAG: YqiA/YcfP family alpha/beta fold hydrolase [Succinivibrionaceae bacterium]